MPTNTTSTTLPPIVDADQWQAAKKEQAALEDELHQHILNVAAARKRMPMTPIEGDYTITGPDGEQKLIDLFGGARQLVIYHFMFAPDWSKGCPHCTGYARLHGPGINDELQQRDTRYILTSRAPYEKLAEWAEQKGIQIPWYSAPTEFSEEMGCINDSFGDFPGISVLVRDDEGKVYRSYHTNSEMVEFTMPNIAFLRFTPWGMQEEGEDAPEGFPQRFKSIG